MRARLESRIDELKDRSQRVTRVVDVAKAQVKRHAPVLIAVGAAAVVLTVVLALQKRARARRRERRDLILNFAGSLLRPGFNLRPPEPKPSFIKTSLKNAGTQLLTTATQELGRRALAELALANHAPNARSETGR